MRKFELSCVWFYGESIFFWNFHSRVWPYRNSGTVCNKKYVENWTLAQNMRTSYKLFVIIQRCLNYLRLKTWYSERYSICERVADFYLDTEARVRGYGMHFIQVLFCLIHLLHGHLFIPIATEFALIESAKLNTTYRKIMVGSVIQCCISCARDIRCESITYRLTKHECYLSPVTFPNVFLDKKHSEGWITYIKPGMTIRCL